MESMSTVIGKLEEQAKEAEETVRILSETTKQLNATKDSMRLATEDKDQALARVCDTC